MTFLQQQGRPATGASSASSARSVAVLVKRFPRLSETFILHEVLELRRQGLAVRIVAVMDPKESVVHPEAAALVSEVRYLCDSDGALSAVTRAASTIRRHPRGVMRALWWCLGRRSWAAWRRLGDALLLVDALADEGVHLHVHFANAPTTIAFLARMVAGQPYSVTMHAKDLYTTPVEHLRERCTPATALVTCTSANATHYAREVDPRAQVHVLPHGLVLDRFTEVQRDPVPGRILTVGRLVAKKGYHDLLAACRLLAERGVPFSWHIIGDGPLRAELHAAIQSSGFADRVRLLGSLPQPDVLNSYAAAQLFALAPVVLPDGDRDGIPNVVLEAMAVGLPVVATAVSGVPEVIADESNGLLCSPGQPQELAEQIQRLLVEPGLRTRLGAAAQSFARSHCDLVTCVAPLTALLAEQQERLGAAVGTGQWSR